MRPYTLLLILLFSHISGFAQFPKGYYFTDIKGTTWLSSENIKDSTLVDFFDMSLSIHQLSPQATLSQNVWIFADSLTIKFYDVSSKTYKTILTCNYVNNEQDHKLLLQLNSCREVQFGYTSVSTGNFIYLCKKKK